MTKPGTPTSISDELELVGLSEIIEEAGYSVGALRIRQAILELNNLERQRDQARRERDAFKELALKLTADEAHKIGVTYSFGGRTHARAQVVNLIESTKPNPGEAT